MKRRSWDNYFLEIAKISSAQSTCIRRQYGCVLVRDKTIISTGYNGSPRGCAHCRELGGCAREGLESGTHHELCRAAHAEQNVIANAARMGICTYGSTLYLYPPHMSCPLCAKILINAGVAIVYYESLEYPGSELSMKLFQEAGVTLMSWKV